MKNIEGLNQFFAAANFSTFSAEEKEKKMSSHSF